MYSYEIKYFSQCVSDYIAQFQFQVLGLSQSFLNILFTMTFQQQRHLADINQLFWLNI